MFVCLCKAISDKDIEEAVHAGAEDFAAVQQRLGTGTGCGTCQEFTQEVITQTLASKLGYAA